MMTSATGLRAQVEDVSDSEAFEVFDRVVRHEMDITGVEFLRRHDAGAYEVDPDTRRSSGTSNRLGTSSAALPR